MSFSRFTSRFAGTVLSRCCSSALFYGGHGRKHFSSFTNQWLSPSGFHDKVVTCHFVLQHHSAQLAPAFQWFGFASTAIQRPNVETAHSGRTASAVDAPDQTDASISKEKTEPTSASEAHSRGYGPVRRRGTKRVAFSDSESDSETESNLSIDDLVKLVVEKEQLLGMKQEELEKMKDENLRTLEEMENVKERTRRESENMKKFAIQNFAKSLLDVADNLGRASAAAKESFSRIDAHEDATGAVHQLKTLLEGVEMTEKQLLEVFRKFGLERYDPVNEEFDPNKHNAVFQVPDASKPADHVAVVLKVGYMLHDQVIRPAEVGVTISANN